MRCQLSRLYHLAHRPLKLLLNTHNFLGPTTPPSSPSTLFFSSRVLRGYSEGTSTVLRSYSWRTRVLRGYLEGTLEKNYSWDPLTLCPPIPAQFPSTAGMSKPRVSDSGNTMPFRTSSKGNEIDPPPRFCLFSTGGPRNNLHSAARVLTPHSGLL